MFQIQQNAHKINIIEVHKMVITINKHYLQVMQYFNHFKYRQYFIQSIPIIYTTHVGLFIGKGFMELMPLAEKSQSMQTNVGSTNSILAIQ